MKSAGRSESRGVEAASSWSPFDRMVVFAPHLHGGEAKVILVLDCGHSIDWGDAKSAPSFLPCASCRLEAEARTKTRH
jgi:hypothetical protein